MRILDFGFFTRIHAEIAVWIPDYLWENQRILDPKVRIQIAIHGYNNFQARFCNQVFVCLEDVWSYNHIHTSWVRSGLQLHLIKTLQMGMLILICIRFIFMFIHNLGLKWSVLDKSQWLYIPTTSQTTLHNHNWLMY